MGMWREGRALHQKGECERRRTEQGYNMIIYALKPWSLMWGGGVKHHDGGLCAWVYEDVRVRMWEVCVLNGVCENAELCRGDGGGGGGVNRIVCVWDVRRMVIWEW